MNEEKTNLWDVLGGNASLKLKIDLDTKTIAYIAGAVFAVGITLIAISKSWPAKR